MMHNMANDLHLKKKGTRIRYKYNINQQIERLPYKPNLIDQIVTHLKAQGITRASFYRDRIIRLNSTQSIPSDRLIIYSKVFECSTEDLLNHTIKARSIRQVMNRATK